MGLHVAMVTSWAPRWCGIAIYSAQLCGALERAGARVSVVAHTDAAIGGVKAVLDQAHPAWPERLEEAVEDLDPDVVHIQHEFGLFATPLPSGEFSFAPEDAFRLAVPLYRWQVRRRPVVVTYHSVFTHLTHAEAAYYDHMMSLATANIVHEPIQKTHLPYNLGRVPDNVFVVPHGAGREHPTVRARQEVRQEMEVSGRTTPARERTARAGEQAAPVGERIARAPERTAPAGEAVVVGMMGWFEPNKGFDRVLRRWPRIRRECPEAVLVLAGEARPGSPTGPRTRDAYLSLARESPAADSIRVVLGTFSPDRYLAILSAFDLMVLPYTYATQSGNLAHAYQVGLPVVVSALEGLKSSVEASRAGLLVRDDEELEQAIIRLIRDASLRRRLSRAARRYVTGVIAWDRVVRRHLEIYRWAQRRARDPARYAHYAAREVHV